MTPNFYENSDNNHCLQCAVRMVLDALLPQVVEAKVVDQDTKYDPNLWTWTISGAKALSQRLENVRIVNGGFDYHEFVDHGSEYLQKAWGQERFRNQVRHASPGFQKEKDLAVEFLNAGGVVEHVAFTEEFIEDLLPKNYVIAQVDWGTLYDKPTSDSHYVLMYSKNDTHFVVHDPGVPPRRTQLIPREKFMSAFSAELIAVPQRPTSTCKKRTDFPHANDNG